MSPEVITMISSVGFPIVACIAMGLYVKYITDKNREDVLALNKEHKDEMQKVTEALNNNTLALQQLSDYLRKEDR